MKRVATLVTSFGIVLLTLLSVNVGYTQHPLADIVLIIDSSGSMEENDPDNVRRDAAKFFIGLADPNIQIAIVDFNGGAKTFARLTFADAFGKNQLRSAIDQIDSDGDTDLFLALRQGLNELWQSNYPRAKKAAVMLTDGQDGGIENPLRAVASYIAEGWSVYTIGLGSDVDLELLQNIARSTPEGDYFPVTLDNMQTVYNRIIANITDDSIVRKYEGYINTGQEVTKYAPIDSSVERAKFATNYATESSFGMLLMDPTGIEITPQSAALTRNITYESSDTFAIYTVDKPKPGKYEMRVIGADIPAQGGKYELTVTATSDFVTNFLAFNPSYSVGDPLRVGIRTREKIGDTTSVLSNAITTAEVVRPDGRIDSLALAYVGNGVYANTYTDVNQLGNYLLRVAVSSGEFSREVEEQIIVGAIDNVSIDSAALIPAVGEALTYAPSRISAAISGPVGKIDHNSIVMKVDDQAVSHVYDCVNQVVSYRPSSLSGGTHTVQLILLDVDGNIIEITWPFTIGSAGPKPSYLYWTNWGDGEIQRSDLDGSDAQSLIVGLSTPVGIKLDEPNGKMYWISQWQGKIKAANLDGSDMEDIITGLRTPYDIALDVFNGKMYWTDLGTGKIQRANLDDTNVQDLVTIGLDTPVGIALDLPGGKMYWTDLGTGKIQRANLDGSKVEDIITGLSGPYGIALDVSSGKMYWTDDGTRKIQRSDLDGLNVEDLITELVGPAGITLDVSNGKMYWSNWATDKIQRANLDGSDMEDLITQQGNVDFGIVLGVRSPDRLFAGKEDVNSDGVVDFQDLVYVMQHYGWSGQNNADVDRNGIVDVNDLILVAAVLENAAAAPTAGAQIQNVLTVTEIQQSLTKARLSEGISFTYQKGIAVLERLLAVLIKTETVPRETALLLNYPNPFNPETWIPYQLSEPADVTLSIYSMNGMLVRRLDLGYQSAGVYQSRSRAAYWDGCNEFGERVASGVYFYTFIAGDFTATRKMLIRK